jgi:hypothetical protein
MLNDKGGGYETINTIAGPNFGDPADDRNRDRR